MGMTLTEKILADRAEIEEIRPGQILTIKPDVILATDATAAPAVEAFRRMGARRVIKADRVVFVSDHVVPARDAAAAESSAVMRRFAEEQGIAKFFEVGRSGISHLLLLEEGLVVPGDVVIGADAHTCAHGALGAFAVGVGSTDVAASWAVGEIWLKAPEAIKVEFRGTLPAGIGGKDLALRLWMDFGLEGARYKALEFSGDAIAQLPVHQRLALCTMAAELGAKNAIIQADEVAATWIRPRAKRNLRLFKADPDARYSEVRVCDVSELSPLVACPSGAAQVKPVEELERIQIDQVVIGSCANGMLEDLREAARILRQNKVNRRVRLLVMPGTPGILRQAMAEGLVTAFLEAGGVVLPPGCGPCHGAHLGMLAEGEVAVSTTPCNLPGCMGDLHSRVYLAGPSVAAASALMGFIADPRRLAV